MKQIYIFNICAILLTVVFFLITKVETAIFGLLNHMESLVKFQRDVIDNITPYIAKVPESNKSAIEQYINLNRKENSIAMENVTLFLANPVNCYIIIKRLTRDLKYVEDILEEHTDYKRKLLRYPSETDFQIAVTQIVLLINLYDIRVKEFAKGIFARNFRGNADMFTAIGLPMTLSDCYEVASHAYKLKEFQIGHDWFTEILRKYYEECNDGSCPFTESDVIRIMKHKRLSLERFDNPFDEQEVMPKEMTPHSNDLHSDKKPLNMLSWWPHVFRKFCYKEQTPQKRLRCQYVNGPHPFLRLARFKTEQLHLEPDIIRYHDVISDKEIEILKYIAEDEIKATNDTYEDDILLGGVSIRNVVFIKDEVSKIATAVSQRSLDISGLTNTMADRVKIVNYGAAGYHGAHVDTSSLVSEIESDFDVFQIPAQATVLFFLSGPDLGGATIFPYLKFSVFPLKNSALYWRTLKPSDDVYIIDYNTTHGSCPVLHGSKWIATKWLSLSDALEGSQSISNPKMPLHLAPLSYDTLRRLENV